MSEETLVSKYKRQVENNKMFALLVAATLVVGAIVAAIGGVKSLIEYFVSPTVEEQAAALAKKGCILFLPDKAIPESDDKFLLDGYKEFWRKSDIYYATRIELAGITYPRGSSNYNLKVGERKTEAAVAMLIKKARLDPEKTEIVRLSYGESRPLERAGEFECGVVVHVFHSK